MHCLMYFAKLAMTLNIKNIGKNINSRKDERKYRWNSFWLFWQKIIQLGIGINQRPSKLVRCANKISNKGISDAFISILIAGPIFYSIGNVIIHTQKELQKNLETKVLWGKNLWWEITCWMILLLVEVYIDGWKSIIQQHLQ